MKNLYSDTMFANTVSRGNNCAQIFATDFGWSRSFLMKLKSKAHEALSLLFQQDEVPPVIIQDNAKGMIQGEFARMLKEALYHLQQTEPFTPWLDVAGRDESAKERFRKKVNEVKGTLKTLG